MNPRAVALAGIGFGAIAVATAGFIVDAQVPPQVVTQPGFVIYEKFAQVSVDKATASTVERSSAKAQGIVSVIGHADSTEGETCSGGAISTVDNRRLAMLDEDLLWL